MKTKSIQSEMIARTALAAASANYFTMSSTIATGQPLGLGAATTDHRRAGARLQV